MAIKFYNPTSAGRRAGSVVDYKAVLTKFEPEKSLTKGKRRAHGRNNHGVITAKHRGGGNKKLYRIIDFKRNSRDGQVATVLSIEYDPNRSVFISLIQYPDGTKSYILAPNGLKVGATVVSGPESPPELGNCIPLANIPGGLEIHNIEMNPGQGGKLVRAAGMVARLSAKEGEWAVVILPSGEMRRIKSKCRATIGQLGNLDFINVSIGKAGRSRHMGIRPHTRAKAMNPIDHPLGGGEGRSNGGRHPVSKTGVPAKGGITRRPRKHSEKLILRRRKFGKFQQRPQTVARMNPGPASSSGNVLNFIERGYVPMRGGEGGRNTELTTIEPSRPAPTPGNRPIKSVRKPSLLRSEEAYDIYLGTKGALGPISADERRIAILRSLSARQEPKNDGSSSDMVDISNGVLRVHQHATEDGLTEQVIRQVSDEAYVDLSAITDTSQAFEAADILLKIYALHRPSIQPVVVGPIGRRQFAMIEECRRHNVRFTPRSFTEYTGAKAANADREERPVARVEGVGSGKSFR